MSFCHAVMLGKITFSVCSSATLVHWLSYHDDHMELYSSGTVLLLSDAGLWIANEKFVLHQGTDMRWMEKANY
jgi:hypothetical protein